MTKVAGLPKLTVTPQRGMIDVARAITITDLPPYAFVTVTADMELCGAHWQSVSTYVTGHDGCLDLRRDGPVSGSYERPSAMGVVWSMVCTELDKVVFPPDRTESLTVKLSAQCEGRPAAENHFVMDFVAEGVTHQSVRETVAGMTISGELFTPAGPGPHPLVIYMNGSSGGVNAPRAALFASRGYQCLALAIFNYEGRPKYLNDMPLEYFGHALRWCRENLKPLNGFVALSGISRGGEASLLVASEYPDLVSAVVAYVPSTVTNGVVSAGAPGGTRDDAVWTRNGEQLPHLWQNNAFADWNAAYATPPPYRQTHAFLSATRDAKALERARIPVEKIIGPVMLVSASDDGFWPSTTYSEMVVRRRRQERKSGLQTLHHVCEGAGHHVHYPYLPGTLINKPHAMSGLLLDAGGTAAANAFANEASYSAVLDFLGDAQAKVAAQL